MRTTPVKSIIYTCPYIPVEWIAAHGLKPVRTMPTLSGDVSPVDVSAGICHYMQSFLYEAANQENAEAVLFTTICDQMRRAPECFKETSSMPVFLMNVPSTWQSVASHKLYVSELRRLGYFLQKLGGEAPANEKLIQVMQDFDSRRRILHSARGTLSPKAYSKALSVFHQTGKMSEHEGSPSPGGIPIGLIGGPLTRRGFSLFDMIEKAGGFVVLDGTETGERTLPRNFHPQNMKNDPLLELADAYFGSIPDAFRRPNSALYQWLQKIIQSRQIKGLIFIRNVWCDIWHGEFQRMRDWLKIPLLDLDLNGNDPVSRNSNRIEAFMELLK